MFNFSAKGALICAVLPIGLMASGCSGIGEAGVNHVVAGNWPAATEDFSHDYADHPAHPIAQFNMGASYHHDGATDKADTMFSEAVVSGKGYVPDGTLEPKSAGDTIAEHACARLHRDSKLDANCGDSMVAAAVIPPAPVAVTAPEPAPAIEAEATVAPEAEVTVAPKQDRN
jgi:hypothetical protein